jgi:probable F420-dependent oxidoreductase
MAKVSFALGQMTLQKPDWDSRTVTELYQDAIDIVELADQLGFHSFWLAEHHGAADSYNPSVLPFLAALASRTQRIGLGTAVMLTPFHNPIRVAEDAAVVDRISGGRLRLGLGLGWSEEEYRMFDAPKKGRGKRLEEFVSILRGAWSPDRFSFTGDHLEADDVLVTPKPHRPIPIFLGGASEAAMKRAATIADGYFPPSTVGGVQGVLDNVTSVLKMRQESGNADPFSFGCFLPIGLGDDADSAWNSIRRGLFHTRGSYLRWAQGKRDLEGCDEDAAQWEESVREQTIHGTPRDVIEQLRPLVEGLSHLPLAEAFISAVLVPVGMPKAQALSTITRYWEEVVSEFSA